ncbi:hypothetical protein CRYUN_Cryun30bG0095600 [Craigia yunnanensis]
MDSSDESLDGGRVPMKVKNEKEASLDSNRDLDHRGVGLYNEAGRNELKIKDFVMCDEIDNANDHYNYSIDSSDSRTEDYDDFGHDEDYILDEAKYHDENVKESSPFFNVKTNNHHVVKKAKEESTLSREVSQDFDNVDVDANSHHISSLGHKFGKSSWAYSKRK